MLVLANKQPLEVESAKRLTIFVHDQGIRLDLPEAVEINGRNTLDCMAAMNQEAWVHISTGPLFRELFNTVFFDDNQQKIPETIGELNSGDFGVTHICGMIVLACEAIFAGKRKIFIRNPETHLHPKTERTVVGMITKLCEIAGGEVKEEK